MAYIQEVMTVSDARAHLSQMISDLDRAGESAEPVVIGSHRKAQVVVLSAAAYGRIMATLERYQALESVKGSLRAEGMAPSSAWEQDAAAVAEGRLSADGMVGRALRRHGVANHNDAA